MSKENIKQNNSNKVREDFYKKFVKTRPGFASDFQSNANDIQESDGWLEASPEEVLEFILEKLENQKNGEIENIRENFDKMMMLYEGDIPYAIFQGTADRRERATIYRQSLEDAISIIKKTNSK